MPTIDFRGVFPFHKAKSRKKEIRLSSNLGTNIYKVINIFLKDILGERTF